VRVLLLTSSHIPEFLLQLKQYKFFYSNKWRQILPSSAVDIIIKSLYLRKKKEKNVTQTEKLQIGPTTQLTTNPFFFFCYFGLK
jgi:hypothetical protein